MNRIAPPREPCGASPIENTGEFMARGRSGGAAPTEQYQAVGQQKTSEKTGKFVNDPVGGAPPSEAIPGTSKAFMRWWIRRTESDLTIGAAGWPLCSDCPPIDYPTHAYPVKTHKR